jgi:quercetin dioxygenase-like cupin family protein
MAEREPRPFVSAPDTAKGLSTPAGPLVTFMAQGDQTGGAFTAFESRPAPGEGPPFHLHVLEDETMHVLEGRLRVRLDETVREAPAGTLVFIPRGVPHSWQNIGETEARFLFLFTPAAPGMERFFERAAELPDEQRADAFGTLAGDAGMQVLGPPLAQSHPHVGAAPAGRT